MTAAIRERRITAPRVVLGTVCPSEGKHRLPIGRDFDSDRIFSLTADSVEHLFLDLAEISDVAAGGCLVDRGFGRESSIERTRTAGRHCDRPLVRDHALTRKCLESKRLDLLYKLVVTYVVVCAASSFSSEPQDPRDDR